MRCGKVRRNLMAYHDGELGMAAGKKVAKHLETCVECSGLLATLRKADQAAGLAGVPEPDSSYWDTFTGKVMDRVKDESPARQYEPEQDAARFRFSPVKFAPALSVALVVVVAAGVLMKMRHPVAPEQVVYREDTVAGKGVSPAPEGKTAADLEAGEVPDLSGQEGITLETAPVKEAGRPLVRKTAPVTYADSVKKEAAADERERPVPLEEEAGTMLEEKDDSVTSALPPATSAGLPSAEKEAAADDERPPVLTREKTSIGFAEKDDSLEVAPAPSLEDRKAGSFMASPSGEDSLFYFEMDLSTEEKEPLPPGDAVNDGSWGQLAFARRLEEEGNHVESEKVLDDLLARNPSVPVQEQASILLVSVLANQNRLPEARQLLRDAQRQYPANMMIQNYRIESSEQ
jgi:anti-sigma factor RsiW